MKKKNPIGWIQSYSGIKVFPLEPDIDSILLPDIAHSLSYQCRFGGHIRNFYSVGQHCILVSLLAEKANEPTLVILAGLLHDATEAYLVDVPRPVKNQISEYRTIEKNLELTISQRFNISLENFEKVKKYDNIALAIESEKLLAPLHPEWSEGNPPGLQNFSLYDSFGSLETVYSPEEGEKAYINRFTQLWSRRKLEGV